MFIRKRRPPETQEPVLTRAFCGETATIVLPLLAIRTWGDSYLGTQMFNDHFTNNSPVVRILFISLVTV